MTAHVDLSLEDGLILLRLITRHDDHAALRVLNAMIAHDTDDFELMRERVSFRGRSVCLEKFCKEKWAETLLENGELKAKLEKQTAQIEKLGDDRFRLTLENDALKEELALFKSRMCESADLPAGEEDSEPPAKRFRAESDESGGSEPDRRERKSAKCKRSDDG